MQSIQKITPCLWFDDQAEEAAKFYTAIFNNSKIVTGRDCRKARCRFWAPPNDYLVSAAVPPRFGGRREP